MRISDWSSDVCSSDLSETACAVSLKFHRNIPAPDATEQAKRMEANELLECGEHYHQPTAHTKKTLISIAADRKSVVYGKSVSVRLDLGGRRIIKKKTNRHINK